MTSTIGTFIIDLETYCKRKKYKLIFGCKNVSF